MELSQIYPLILLFIGIATIGIMIVGMKANALIALIVAALVVGLLSPRVVLQTPQMDSYETLVKKVNDVLGARNVDKAKSELAKQQEAINAVEATSESTHPRLALLNAPRLVAYSFGDMMGRIGLAIAFASIVGRGLMESGAADRIVRFFTNLFGERFGGIALLASGYLLSVPVFFDTVFLLLIPLAKALRLRTGRDYLLYVTAIGAGGAITHSLVPPTPGPIGMAEILKVKMGTVIVVGFLFGLPLAAIGYAYAVFANRRWPTPLRAAGDVTMEELERRALHPDHELPSLGVSLLPIVLPVLCITAATAFEAYTKVEPDFAAAVTGQIGGVTVALGDLLDFFGNPTLALFLSALITMVLVKVKKGMNLRELAAFTTSSLDDASMILLITCAGGSFGFMLRAVGLGDSLQALTPTEGSGQFILILGWAVAVLFKIAQGSGTVSMITTAGILMPIVTSGMESKGQSMADFLGYHPVYLVMAIGCGSKVGSWMNDSGFWVVCKMGGLTEAETLRSWTMTLVVMGVSGLPLLLLLTRFVPLT